MSQLEMVLQQRDAATYFKVYAYLTTTRRTQSDTNNVLDCLLPFIRAGIALQKHDSILDVSALKEFLDNLRLSIPYLVLVNFRARLHDLNILTWRNGEYYMNN